MSIQINEEIVLAKTQTIEFQLLRIEKDSISGNVFASVVFSVVNERGEVIGQKSLNYTGEEFNTFWSGFTSGKFLFDEVVEKENIDVVVPPSVELDFINIPTDNVINE